ncbi:hypothetical protein [Citricoccus sp. GCM10030269]|uniref:hypothetical protein n=1 Tax=Citricoccus sp. GCM10030269 TaxID=3273388 RepID=UPI003614BFF1
MSTETTSVKRSANPFIMGLILFGAAVVLWFVWWSTTENHSWVPLFDVGVAGLAAWLFLKEPVKRDMSLQSLRTLRAVNGGIVLIALVRALASAITVGEPWVLVVTLIASVVGIVIFGPIAWAGLKEFGRGLKADRKAAGR